MAHQSIDKFSRVVEAIYDCALDPDNWRGVLPQLAHLLESEGSTFQVLDLAKGDRQRYFDYGLSETAVRSYFEVYAPLNPIHGAAPFMIVGEPSTVRMLVPEAEFVESRFYREWVKPNRQGDLMTMLVLRAGQRVATHAVNRLDSQPRYSQDELSLYRLLAPHICRSLTISDALDLKTINSRLLEETLDGLVAGVYLISHDGRVVHMNQTAELQVADGCALALANNRLTPVDKLAAQQLAAALKGAFGDEAAPPTGGSSIALPNTTEGGGLIATVLPLRRGRRHSLSQPFAAAAAVFVQDPQIVPPLPGEAFARLYGLTAGELRVALAMAPGLPPQEVADILGISLATVKSHLARIFSKTSTTRQTELASLMMRASAR